MNKKIISVISYITIIGWIIAFVLYNNGEKSSLAKYHLKQSLGLAILGVLIGITSIIVASIIPSISILFSILSLIVFIFWILGIINALNEKELPLPIIGSVFVDKFTFIK